MDFFKKTKEKLVQTVNNLTQHNCTDADLNAGVKKLDSLEVLLQSFRGKVVTFSTGIQHLGDTNEQLTGEIQHFYRKNESRQKTLTLFASVQGDGQYAKFKDSLGWDVLQQVDAWLSEVDDLKENTRALDFALSKNNNASNQQDKQALVAEINKMVETRFGRFDKIFIRFMEIQRDFFKAKSDSMAKFAPVITSFTNKPGSSNSNVTEEKTTSPKSVSAAAPAKIEPKPSVPEPVVVEQQSKPTVAATPSPVKTEAKPAPAEVDLFGGFATSSSSTPAPAPAPAPAPVAKPQANLFDIDFTSSTPATSPAMSAPSSNVDSNVFDLFNSTPAKPAPAATHDTGFDILGLNSVHTNNNTSKPSKPATIASGNNAFDPTFFTSHSNNTSSTTNNNTYTPTSTNSYNDIDGIDDDVSSPAAATATSAAAHKPVSNDLDMDFGFLSSSSAGNKNSKMDSFDPLSSSFSSTTKTAPKSDFVPQVVNTGPVLSEGEEKTAIANIRQTSEPRIIAWKSKQGQDKTIQALLSSLETVLWEGHSWKKMDSTQLLDYNSVKKAYRRALLTVHPDKVSGGTPEMKAIADSVFDILNVAYKNYEVSLGMRAA